MDLHNLHLANMSQLYKHFAIFFLLNIYIFATYLQEANLCKSIQIRPVKDQGAR